MTDAPSGTLIRHVRLGPGGPLRDLRIKGDRVAAVLDGASPEPGERVVDAEGGTVLPGLWDSHVHSGQWAVARRRVDLTPAGSAQEAVALVAAAARGTAAGGGVLEGHGYRDAFWPERPHKRLLEAALPGRPVVLLSNDLHTAWFSPAALALVGLGEHPTGVLLEKEAYAAVAALPPAPPRRLDEWVTEAMTAAAARGVVGILDFEYADNPTDWARRASERRLDVRVACSLPAYRLDDAIARGLRTGEPIDGGGSLLEMGPIKLFVDGSLNTRTAYCEAAYPDGAHGRLETPGDELRAVMERAAAHGLRCAVHAIGDLAVDIALSAIEDTGYPARVEHAQLVRERDLPRFARPGLIASVQPAHQPDDRDVADAQWHGRTGRAFPYAGLLAAGATLEFGSDAPVAPLDPWDGIAAAVFRTDDDRPAWHPEQAIPLEAALAAASRGRTAVAEGDVADLVIVEHDPATVTAAGLAGIGVWGTMLAGRWTHGPMD